MVEYRINRSHCSRTGSPQRPDSKYWHCPFCCSQWLRASVAPSEHMPAVQLCTRGQTFPSLPLSSLSMCSSRSPPWSRRDNVLVNDCQLGKTRVTKETSLWASVSSEHGVNWDGKTPPLNIRWAERYRLKRTEKASWAPHSSLSFLPPSCRSVSRHLVPMPPWLSEHNGSDPQLRAQIDPSFSYYLKCILWQGQEK